MVLPGVVAGVIGIVSGSGLDLRALLSQATEEFSFTDQLPFPIDPLEGHDRRFILGTTADGHDVVLQCGRLHFYEGYSFEEVVGTVDILRAFGVDTIIFTNVVGGLRETMSPGDIVSLRELRTWPFQHWKSRPESVLPDFTMPGCDHEGIYYWMHGPSYETPAEICALQRLGGDVVGMSTAPEVARCKEVGIRCAAVSVVTNNCCTPQVLTHDDVVRVARSASEKLVVLLRGVISAL